MAARVTYIDTISALSAIGSSTAPTLLPPPWRRASQPSRASEAPANRNRMNAASISCCSTSQTASGTAQSRAKLMMFGSVTSPPARPASRRPGSGGRLV